MMLPKFVRNMGIRAMKSDLLDFLDDNEDELVKLVRAELEALDDRTPDEEAFVDIKLGELGEEITIAMIRAVKRFIREY